MTTRVLHASSSRLVGVLAITLALGFGLSELARRVGPEWTWERAEALWAGLTGLDVLVTRAPGTEGLARWGEELGRRFAGLPGVSRVVVWSREPKVLWSTRPKLVGQTAQARPELENALAGRVALAPNQDAQRRDREAPRRASFATVYLPVLSELGEVLGVLELREGPGQLRNTAAEKRAVAWAISLASGVALYFAAPALARQTTRWRRRDGLGATETPRGAVPGAAGPALVGTPNAVDSEGADGDERLRKLGELAGRMAHDFNNKLTAILGRTHLLLERAETRNDVEFQRQLKIIELVALDGTQVVRRIREFTRGAPPRPRGRVRLDAVIEDVLEITRSRWGHDARVSGIGYDVECRSAAGPTVAADAVSLREALTNLVLNALDAMPKGGRMTITSGVDGQGPYCVVADTGTGMSDEVRRRLFEPFFTTKGSRGTGLGLCAVRAIVTEVGGTVRIDSRVGHGTSVTLRWPAAAVGEEPNTR